MACYLLKRQSGVLKYMTSLFASKFIRISSLIQYNENSDGRQHFMKIIPIKFL